MNPQKELEKELQGNWGGEMKLEQHMTLSLKRYEMLYAKWKNSTFYLHGNWNAGIGQIQGFNLNCCGIWEMRTHHVEVSRLWMDHFAVATRCTYDKKALQGRQV